MSFYKFIDEINLIDDSDVDFIQFGDNELINIKFNLDSKLQNICFKFVDYNIINVNYDFNCMNPNKCNVKIDFDILKSNIKKCDFIPIIFAVNLNSLPNNYTKHVLLQHVYVLILNIKEKKAVLFNTLQKLDNLATNLSKLILKNLDINFEIIKSSKNVKKMEKILCCLPASFLFIYSYIKYRVKIDDFLSFFESKTLKFNIYTMNKFVKFLEIK